MKKKIATATLIATALMSFGGNAFAGHYPMDRGASLPKPPKPPAHQRILNYGKKKLKSYGSGSGSGSSSNPGGVRG